MSKPLPATPPHSGTELSLDATTHLERIVSAAVAEENLPTSWVPRIIDALNTLGTHIENEAWIKGFRNTRTYKNELESRAILSSLPGDAISSSATPAETTRDFGSSSTSVKRAKSPSPEKSRDLELNTRAIILLRQLTSNAQQPLELSSSRLHLVLTLAPRLHASIASFYRHDATGDCEFVAGKWFLPRSNMEGFAGAVSGTEITGIESFKSLYRLHRTQADNENEEPDVAIVGGSFFLRGASEASRMSIVKVLRISVYSYLSLLLEVSFLRSSGVQLVYPPPPVPVPPEPVETHHVPSRAASPPPNPLSRVKSKTRHTSKGSSGGIWGFLTRKTSELKRFRTRSITNASASSTEDAHEVPLPDSRPSTPVPSSPKSAHKELPPNSPLTSPPHSPQPNTPRLPNPAPFTMALNSIQSPHSIFSTSPNVHFPPPNIIVRLATEEAHAFAQVQPVTSLPPSPRANATLNPPPPAPRRRRKRLTAVERTSLSSVLGWRSDNLGTGFGGVGGFLRHQALTVLVSYPDSYFFPPSRPGLTPGDEAMSTTSAGVRSGTISPSSRPGTAMSMNRRERDKSDGEEGGSSRFGIPSTRGKSTSMLASSSGTSHARWQTMRYYAEGEKVLSDMVLQMCDVGAMSVPPLVPPTLKGGDSGGDGESISKNPEWSWSHAGMRITATAKPREADVGVPDGDEDQIAVFASCVVCGEKTKSSVLNHGAYLLDFGKYLELLFYSPDMSRLDPPLCEHTSVPPHSPPPEPHPSSSDHSHLDQRCHLVWHFSAHSQIVSFRLSRIENLFDVRIPRFQVVKSLMEVNRKTIVSSVNGKDGRAKSTVEPMDLEALKQEKDALRLEMVLSWKSLKDHVHLLDRYVREGTTMESKRLPLIPSDSAGEEAERNTSTTPTSHKPEEGALYDSPLSLSIASSTRSNSTGDHLASSSSPHASSAATSSSTASLPEITDILAYIAASETSLYSDLANAHASLSDVRRTFMQYTAEAVDKLRACVDTHQHGALKDAEWEMDVDVGLRDTSETLVLPEWWRQGVHCLPGSGVLVREGEWGSIIAFTLRSSEYESELDNLALRPAFNDSASKTADSVLSKAANNATATSTMINSKQGPSAWQASQSDAVALATSAQAPRKTSIFSTQPPQNRQASTNLEPPPSFSATMLRKENPRDVGSLLSIRGVLLHRRSHDSTAMHNSRFGSLGSISGTRVASGPLMAPKGAWAKPDVQVSLNVAGGEVTSSQGTMSSAESSKAESILSSSSSTAPLTSLLHVADPNLPKPPEANDAPPPAPGNESRSATPTPPRESRSFIETATPSSRPPLSPNVTPTPSTIRQTPHSVDPSPSRVEALTATVTSAIRYALHPSTILASNHEHHEAPPEDLPHRLALLGRDNSAPRIDDKPHLQYDFTVGERLRFSCTVYYALQFSDLRKQCGVEDVMLKSLERTVSWLAEGGKSKSSFYKTTDDRFIIKTLVNAWNVAELQVLLELAPSYFRYMTQTQDKPSSLAKMLGFYTVEVKNLETGQMSDKVDLLVMENLFYGRQVSKCYDLKGIKSRKVKEESSSSTLWDHEWLELQRNSPIYLGPRSKHVLREALEADTNWLSNSNIMDYSLLLGIDRDSHEIICGLVDTFGTYTIAKTLESKAKHQLQTGREVTVIPPVEYQARFAQAMDQYFVSIPDKWTKPVPDGSGVGDFFKRTSVL